MIEQFNINTRLVFAILNGKVSAAINRKMLDKFRENNLNITPEDWTILIYLWSKDGVTQQHLCNATYKDKPSMTRLIDNMEKKHLVVRIFNEKDKRSNFIFLTKDAKKLKDKVTAVVNETLKESLKDINLEDLEISQNVLNQIFINTK